MSEQDISNPDLRTALTLVASEISRLAGVVDSGNERLQAIEIRQEGTRLELVGINRRLDIGNERMDVANGRTTKNEQRIDALYARNHDSDLIAATRKEQVEEVKRKAFSLVRALDNKLVTSLVIAALVLTGWTLREVWPW